MHTPGHIGGGLLVYTPVFGVYSTAGEPELASVGLVVAATFSVLPDIDEKLPVQHRGPTHTIWFVGAVTAVVFAATAGLASSSPHPLTPAAFLSGTALLSLLSHLAADIVTPMGIAPFRPVSEWHYSFDLVLSKDSRTNLALFSLGTLSAGVVQAGVLL